MFDTILSNPLVIDGLLHQLEFLVRHMHGGLVKGLTVITLGVTPTDVLIGGLLEMVLDVLEGYPTRTSGCFQTPSESGSSSPVNNVMMVDLPAPLGPMQATREASEQRIATPATWGRLAEVCEGDTAHLDDGLTTGVDK